MANESSSHSPNGGPPIEAVACCGDVWVRFAQAQAWLEASSLEDVAGVLEQVDDAARQGLFAVGAVAYEAAAAFDPALKMRDRGSNAPPLVAFGLFKSAERVSDPIPPFSAPDRSTLRAEELVEASDYRAAIDTVRGHIAGGDVYQVNYTFPLRVSRTPARADSTPAEETIRATLPDTLSDQLLRQLCRSQGGAYACRLTGPGLEVVSGSPELFFERDGDLITCRPMKGTAARGRFREEDEQLAAALRASPKERAENLMIVDMMRNDLGRIAHSGSVTVDRLFEVERLPTLHQMTSTVTARTDATLVEIFGALFPCASITGAPKSSAMRIIAKLEQEPRGIYTGAAGVVLPASPKALGWTGAAAGTVFDASPRDTANAPYARFGVTIRTAWRAGSASDSDDSYRYGIGSGVVWDSEADAELAETRSKALGLGLERPAFELLETMALRALRPSDSGTSKPGLDRVRLWPQHRQRLLDSAAYFAFRLEIRALEEQLAELCCVAAAQAQKVRLRVAADGSAQFDVEPLGLPATRPWRIVLCDRPVETDDPFLFHKTTRRELYTERLDAVRNRAPKADDAILRNEDGQITETTIANVLLPPARAGERWRTPPRTAGLLAGTLRAELLRRGRIIEADLSVEDLRAADRILLINSVRGVFPATLIRA